MGVGELMGIGVAVGEAEAVGDDVGNAFDEELLIGVG